METLNTTQSIIATSLRWRASGAPSASGDVERLILCSSDSASYDSISGTHVNNGIGGTFGEREIIHPNSMSLAGKNGLSHLRLIPIVIIITRSGDSEILDWFTNDHNIHDLLPNSTPMCDFSAPCFFGPRLARR